MSESKKQLGQYYSTNADAILKGFNIDKKYSICEPFIGNGDLIKWSMSKGVNDYEAYDINPPKTLKFKCSIRDTLANPPNYVGKFVLTNPPYLARNKSVNKELYGSYNDLYKLFISQLISGKASAGAIIIPLNFLCGTRKADCKLRDMFFVNYDIKRINIFEKPIFDDTTYTVCSILFSMNKKINKKSQKIKVWWHDNKKLSNLIFKKKSFWVIGGDIYNFKGSYKVNRLVAGTDKKKFKISSIQLYGLDNRETKIRLCKDPKPYVGKNTDRMRATIVLPSEINITEDLTDFIIYNFNEILNKYREKYNSLFLTTYRDFGRKRIGFDLAYNIISYIIDGYYEED